MTALPEWMTRGLTAQTYDELPEEVCRTIEVVDGAIIVSPSPSRWHQDVVYNLAAALKSACGPNLRVTIDVDLRLADVPLLNRRPDVVVYRAGIPDDEVLRPADVVLAAEVTSPASVTTDRVDKPGEYAAAGIPRYWRLDPAESAVYAYRLTPTGGSYLLEGKYTGRLAVTEPVRVDIDVSRLFQP
jgi:Uma2 family endonuclease